MTALTVKWKQIPGQFTYAPTNLLEIEYLMVDKDSNDRHKVYAAFTETQIRASGLLSCIAAMYERGAGRRTER